MGPKKGLLKGRSKRLQKLQEQWRSEKAIETPTTVIATSAVVTSSTSVVVTTSCATSTVVVTVCSTATSSAVSSSASHDTVLHTAIEEFVPLAQSTPRMKKNYRKVASERSYQAILFGDDSNPASDGQGKSDSSIPNPSEVQLPSTSGIFHQGIQRKKGKKVLNFEDVEAMLLSTSLDLSALGSVEEESDEEERLAPLPPDVVMNHKEGEIAPFLSGNVVSSEYQHLMEEIIHSEIEEEEEVHPIAQDVEAENLPKSEAEKRCDIMKGFSGNIIPDDANGNDNIFVELSQLNLLLAESFICKNCDSNQISFKIKETKSRTFVNQILAFCNSCKKTISSKSSSSVQPLPQSYKKKFTKKNNIRFALGAISSGIGYTKANKFFSHLNIPPLSYGTYNELLSDAVSLIERKLESMKEHAADVVRNYYKDNLLANDVDGAIDIAVSFDGTWMTRGHASHYGVCFVIDSATGIILDVHLSSNYCQSCKIKKKALNPQAYKQWYMQHKNSNQCHCNYDPLKSSGGMESHGAQTLFGRSMVRKLRYSTIISDEDSSTFVNLTKSNFYGEDHPIKKVNCLNHISKKIYRKLDEVRVKQRLGGVGEGKLTQNCANAFANFYRIAVKQYVGDNNKIRKTVLASIFHHASTDAKPMHHLCNAKWCKYKKDLSEGKIIAPNWHVDKENRTHSLNEKSSIAVFRILGEMLQDKVLDLVSGKTQNINESVHSKLWNLVPKASFRGYRSVLYSVAQTVLEHNCGLHEGNIYQNLGVSVGKELHIGASRLEKKRKKILKAREGRAIKRKRKEAEKKSKDYDPGAF